MPTITQRASAPNTTEEQSPLLALRRIQDHPSVQPLAEQHSALRHRLNAIAEAIRAKRTERYLAGPDDSYTGIVTRRTMDDDIAQLEAEAATIERDLGPVGEDLELAQATVKAELKPLFQARDIPRLERIADLMEALSAETKAYALEARQAQRVCGAPTLAGHIVFDATLARRVKVVRERVTKLKGATA